jgi:hypothetical protein
MRARAGAEAARSPATRSTSGPRARGADRAAGLGVAHQSGRGTASAVGAARVGVVGGAGPRARQSAGSARATRQHGSAAAGGLRCLGHAEAGAKWLGQEVLTATSGDLPTPAPARRTAGSSARPRRGARGPLVPFASDVASSAGLRRFPGGKAAMRVPGRAARSGRRQQPRQPPRKPAQWQPPGVRRELRSARWAVEAPGRRGSRDTQRPRRADGPREGLCRAVCALPFGRACRVVRRP